MTSPNALAGGSDLERTFDHWWRVLGGPDLVHEHRFHPKRRWRLDRAHEATLVAVELEGGVWSGGRHVRPAGFERDCEKYFEATRLGWAVYRLTAKMLQDDPDRYVGGVLQAIRQRGGM